MSALSGRGCADMLTERDYERCARLMIESYGMYAAVRAKRHARSLLDRDMPSAHDIWCQVAGAIERLQASDQEHRLRA
jgi:hypothetical protein